MLYYLCPECEARCDRDSVDNGVGIIYGPYGCPYCGWSEYPEYDSRAGIVWDGEERVLDQYGASHHVSRPGGLDILAENNVVARGYTKL